MPQSKSQRENSRAKSTSPTNFNKPIPGKRILHIDIDQVNVRGVSKKYLNAPVSGWTSPSKLINSIQVDNMLNAGPQQALDHIRKSLENIGKSSNIAGQLSRYAANCHKYSLKPKFSEEFINLYAAKRGRVQDCALKEKSRILSSKAMDSASDITDKALDILKESTLREMSNEHYEVNDADQNELANKEDAKTDSGEFMGPARLINHSPNQPKLSTIHIENVQNNCFIAISSMPLFLMPPFLREVLNSNYADQKVLKSLGNFPSVLRILNQMMDDNVEYSTFPQNLWSFQSQAIMWSPLENEFFSVIAIIMTDFWGLFKRIDFNRNHERTFWVEYVVPLFKHFSTMNKGVIFSWCESLVLSHGKSQIIPGVWNNTTEKLFADGVGRQDGFEIVIMESSGPFLTENIEHSVDDTWKLITMTTNSLRNEILKYQDASIETAKG
ncbi:hypothetical protein G6F55_000995 [Rhizopus delemar]|uniref:Uncharacterized protein n=3 Tax=Rhizopus TaxID=4842 RepID=I1C2E9_RHIO9|nr:hypothetical protein RO3G_07334 [Rhizopus delemar RA 99-880]KAG1465665.1 hypothetical protein G6F55_000995 [Rhizopus delemar]KAG1544712.1 hypothetical protein G6F51_005898 [Rhizopus arrhizus]KAG1498391.1 hypothetical protein G6F54_005114 [Rhizopus delemar]KAG1509360.1 hypothetical protein G6F52_011155 [Rhizopus delemar]|eukprot:EIE82629.1 hypothetical protein RO3G_07334 [Rhizopus delemar RA 99-880]